MWVKKSVDLDQLASTADLDLHSFQKIFKNSKKSFAHIELISRIW